MNRRSVIGLSVTAVLGLSSLSGPALSKQASLKKQIVGTWLAVSVSVQRPDGSKLEPFGPNPNGVTIFTSDGRFALINTRPGRAKFASNNRLEGTPDENKATVQGTLAYFGTYTVNEADRSFSIHIDADTFPNDEGIEQKRPFTITGDELKYTNPAGTVGGAPVEVALKRAK
jgi:hypothetical protein